MKISASQVVFGTSKNNLNPVEQTVNFSIKFCGKYFPAPVSRLRSILSNNLEEVKGLARENSLKKMTTIGRVYESLALDINTKTFKDIFDEIKRKRDFS